jgi:hypothetical protein
MTKVDDRNLLNSLRHLLTDTLSVTPADTGFQIVLPFNDSSGEPIELFMTFSPDGELLLDDLGHTAGLLFHLAQHAEDTPGHMLVKNLAHAYRINMDYNQGMLQQRITSIEQRAAILNFIKTLISIQTTIPNLQIRKGIKRRGKRLGTRLAQEIKQLRLPEHVQRVVEVAGKHEIWVVDYKYVHTTDGLAKDVLIVTADLSHRDPKEKAAHVLTLAYDVLAVDRKPTLRVVYEVNGNGRNPAVQRAADLIEDYKGIGYEAYNYSDPKQRRNLSTLTLQELSPILARLKK